MFWNDISFCNWIKHFMGSKINQGGKEKVLFWEEKKNLKIKGSVLCTDPNHSLFEFWVEDWAVSWEGFHLPSSNWKPWTGEGFTFAKCKAWRIPEGRLWPCSCLHSVGLIDDFRPEMLDRWGGRGWTHQRKDVATSFPPQHGVGGPPPHFLKNPNIPCNH